MTMTEAPGSSETCAPLNLAHRWELAPTDTITIVLAFLALSTRTAWLNERGFAVTVLGDS